MKEYTEKMGEISGMGGGYEKVCRDMVLSGVEHLEKNPESVPEFKEYKNIYGITADENEDMKKLQKVMLKASRNDCTGAMMQASTSHVLFVKKNGWKKYVEEMTQKIKEPK